MSGTLALTQGRPIGAAWLPRRRVLVYAAVLLGVEVAGLLFCIAGTHGWVVPLPNPVSTDFVSFYAAGVLTNAGTPALVYDHAAHHAAEMAATEPGIRYNYFYYPPVYLLICSLLARLPYLAAFIGFEAATLLPCLLVARRILRERGWAILLPLLAFPSVFYTLGIGQNAFLTAALFGGATLLLDRRPVLAGMLFGALCYKPHFGLLVPVALAAAGHWRSFAAAGATAAALIAISVLAFGLDTWGAYLTAMAGAHEVYESHVSLAGMASPFGATLVLGFAPSAAYAVQGVVTAAMIALVFQVWRRMHSLPVRAATLLAATPIALPLVMFYDLMLDGMALAWLVRADRPRWLGTAIVGLYGALLLTGNFDPKSHMLITPMIALATLAITLAAAYSRTTPPARA